MDIDSATCALCERPASRVCRFCGRSFCDLHAKEYAYIGIGRMGGEGVWCDECRANWRLEKRDLYVVYLIVLLVIIGVIVWESVLRH